MPWATCLCALLLLSGCGGAPDFVFTDGRSGDLEDWSGQWLAINYWAEWCEPCQVEIPELNALHDDQSTAMAVFGVNFDGHTGARLDDAITRMEIAFPVLVDDPRPIWGYAMPDVLPVTVLVDPAGQVRARLAGPQTRATLLAHTQ